MSTAVQPRARVPLRDLLELGEFTLLLRDETVESGALLAKQIREAIAAEVAKRDLILALVYEIEIIESEVEAGSRKSKNRIRLKRKKSLIALVSWVGFSIGVLSADYDKIPHNLESACQAVVTTYKQRGNDVEITEKNFPPVGPTHPADDPEPPG
jgi:hypothetical protein